MQWIALKNQLPTEELDSWILLRSSWNKYATCAVFFNGEYWEDMTESEAYQTNALLSQTAFTHWTAIPNLPV